MAAQYDFADTLKSLSTQAHARTSALDLMTHTLRHMEIYIDTLGSKLAQNGMLNEVTVRRLEAAMQAAQGEIEALDHTLQTCSWKPREMAQLVESRGQGEAAALLLERYREQGCWSDEKRFQIGRVFEATVRKWWGEQKRAVKEVANVSLHDDLDSLFASHYPASKQYWRMDTETYRERVEAAAERLFPQTTTSAASSITATVWKAAGSLFSTFKQTIASGITHLARLLRRHWKAALLTAGILALALAAATFVPVAVAASALASATTGYSAAMVAISPFCPLFYTVEAMVGVSYVLRMLLGVRDSPVNTLADQAYVYKSPTLEQVMLSLDRSDVVQGWRQVLATRFHYKLKSGEDEDEAHTKKLETLVMGDTATTTDSTLRVLYQCIYWANFALSFACASAMNSAQANLTHVDRARDLAAKASKSSTRVQRLVDHCREIGAHAISASRTNISSSLSWELPSLEIQQTLGEFVGGMGRLSRLTSN